MEVLLNLNVEGALNGKELQAELRAQGQTVPLCWQRVVRKAGSARTDQSNR